MTHRRKVDDEMLMALADGELDADLAREIERAVAADPELARRLEEFRESRDLAREAYGDVADEPVPAVLRSSVDRMLEKARPGAADAQGTGKVVTLGAAVSRRARPYRLPLAIAMAAVLTGITGYFLGAGLLKEGSPDPLLVPGIQAEAGRLQELLGSLPAGERRTVVAAEPHVDLTVISSFRTGEGRLCREFELTGPAEDASLAVACHWGEAWRVTFYAESRRSGGGFQPASGAELVETYLHGIEAGEPLSPQGEAAALAALKAARR